jgi:hypothetical protein
MERYRYRDELEFIHYTISTLPKRVQEILIGTHFVTGYSHEFLGIPCGDVSDGRSFDEISFVIPYEERPHIFFIREHVFDRKIVLHELGHAARILLRDDCPDWIDPLNTYAATNYHESYATAFQSFLTREPLGLWYYHNWEELITHDIYTYRYFEKQFGVSPHNE